MLPKTNDEHKKQQPQTKDPNAREEAQPDDLHDIQPMVDEAANIAPIDQMLREANVENELYLSQKEG